MVGRWERVLADNFFAVARPIADNWLREWLGQFRWPRTSQEAENPGPRCPAAGSIPTQGGIVSGSESALAVLS
jgi:hypothetical protein